MLFNYSEQANTIRDLIFNLDRYRKRAQSVKVATRHVA